MSILTAGAVYCPLSPRDPPQRLQASSEAVKSRLLLVDWATGDKFNSDTATIDIDSAISIETLRDDQDHNALSTVAITSDSVAFVIFTSGSTGKPKGV